MAKAAGPTTPEQYIASLDDPRRSEIEELHTSAWGTSTSGSRASASRLGDLDRSELAKLLRTAASSQPPDAADA